jgi:Ser/Thr protein kinase RdoA (MazF antagonist)
MSASRADRLAGRLGPDAISSLKDDIANLPGLLAGRPPGVVHGDLAPVNLLIRHGALAAVLDVEFARLAEPLLDAAWFDWIVTFHHPGQAGAARQAFASAAGLDVTDPTVCRLLRILPRIRLLELLDEDGLTPARTNHWLGMLDASLSSPVDA